jgi:hypothetical protein
VRFEPVRLLSSPLGRSSEVVAAGGSDAMHAVLDQEQRDQRDVDVPRAGATLQVAVRPRASPLLSFLSRIEAESELCANQRVDQS